MKKMALILLCVIMMLAMVACDDAKDPVVPEEPVISETAVSSFEYELSQDKDYIIINKYIGTEEDVRIPEKIENLPVTIIGSGAFKGKDLKSLTIPNSVIIIGDSAFMSCMNLTDISFGDGITQIGYQAFYECTALKKVLLPKNLKILGTEAFAICSSLEEVTVPKTLTSWGMRCFANNFALVSVKLEDGLQAIGYSAFMQATKLETVTIPASVDVIDYAAFGECTLLKSVTFLGDAPTEMSKYVFGRPNKNFIIYYNPDTAGWDNSLLKDWHTLVVYDNPIPSIPTVMPTEAPTKNANADFEYSVGENYVVINKYLGNEESVTIPEKIENRPVTIIGSAAFKGKDLKSVFMPDSITIIEDNAFRDCKNLTDIQFSNEITEIESQAFYACTALKKVVLPSTLEIIGGEVFCECTALEEITIPKSLTVWSMGCFLGNSALTSITLEDGLKAIGYATFHSAVSLETLTIPASIDAIDDRAFASCDALKTVTFLGDAPAIGGPDVFGFPNKDLIIYYDSDTFGWDTTPLKDWYTLVAK